MRYQTMAEQLARQQQRLNLPWNDDFKMKKSPQIDFAERTPLPECALSAVQRRQMHVLRARVCKVNPDNNFLEIWLIDRMPSKRKHIFTAFCMDGVEIGQVVDVLYREIGRFETVKVLGATKAEFLPEEDSKNETNRKSSSENSTAHEK